MKAVMSPVWCWKSAGTATGKNKALPRRKAVFARRKRGRVKFAPQQLIFKIKIGRRIASAMGSDIKHQQNK
jgi:hypothetical protein